jgi:CheY-like chemotaxis protein
VAGDRILVVDDNELNLRLLRWLLEKHGYEVHTAVDAETARAGIRAVQPRLVLMDIQLPDIDGLQLTREFKADPALREIPIVAVTSYAMSGDQQKAIDAGCEGYITKPIDTAQFPKQIAKYLRRETPE